MISWESEDAVEQANSVASNSYRTRCCRASRERAARKALACKVPDSTDFTDIWPAPADKESPTHHGLAMARSSASNILG